MNIRKRKLGAFKDELIALYRKHGVSIGHEDHHGAFIIRDLREDDIRWIKEATNETTEPPTCAHCAAGAIRIRRHGTIQHLSNISGVPAWWDCAVPQGALASETPQAMPFSKPDGSYDPIAETEAALRGVHPYQVGSDGAPIWRDCRQCGNPMKTGACTVCGASE